MLSETQVPENFTFDGLNTEQFAGDGNTNSLRKCLEYIMMCKLWIHTIKEIFFSLEEVRGEGQQGVMTGLGAIYTDRTNDEAGRNEDGFEPLQVHAVGMYSGPEIHGFSPFYYR